MMRWIVGSSLKFRILVVACAAGMMFVGFGQLAASPVDVFPEFAPPRVEVQTPCLGLSATEVEGLITVPLEQTLAGVTGLDEMRSKSVSQLSQIELIFKPGTDLLQARQLVQERIATVTPTLPSWATPPVIIQPLSATSRVMKIGISSPDRTLIEQSMIAFWNIRAKLLGVPGVANVAIWGQRKQMLHVQADPNRMKLHDVTLKKVMTVTSDALDAGLLKYAGGAVVGTGGIIETPNQQLGVQHVLPITSPEELSKVLVEQRGGKPIRLGDVADIVIDHQPLIGDAVINDGPGLMLIVEKLPWGNTLEVTRGVEAALAELAPGLTGIEIDTTIFRPATFIEMAIDNLTLALLLGCLLVLLVIGAFLFEWRTALTSMIAIPLSLVAAWLVLSWRGVTINTMILAGFVIAVGVVVDDAIIDIENIVRRIRQHRREGSDKSLHSIILDASVEVRAPILYATLIIVAAAAPVFFLTGLTGAFFQPLALAYTLAVLASLVVAMTVTPALALILLRGVPLERRDPPLTRWLQKGYGAVLARMVGQTQACLRAAGGGGRRGDRDPSGPWQFATAQLQGARLPDALGDRAVHLARRDGSDHRGVQPRAAGRAGRPQFRCAHRAGGQRRRTGRHQLHRELGQRRPQRRLRRHGQTHRGGGQRVPGAASRRADLSQGTNPRGPVWLGRRHRRAALRRRPGYVARQGRRGEKILDGITGVVDQHVSLQTNVPQIDVQVKLEEAQKLRPQTRRRAPGRGRPDGHRGGRRPLPAWPDLRRAALQHPGDRAATFPTLKNLPLDTAQGGTVTLGEVADVSVKPTPNLITHDAGSRKLDVGANFAGRDLGSIIASWSRNCPLWTSRPGTTPKCSGNTPNAAPRADHALPCDRRGDRDPGPAPRGVRPLAPGDHLHSSPSRPRWSAASWPPTSAGVYLAGIARRVLHRARHRRAQRDSDDQPLPASRTRGRRAVRPGPRAARCS